MNTIFTHGCGLGLANPPGLSDSLGPGFLLLGLLVGDQVAVGILHYEPTRTPVRSFGFHSDLHNR